MKRWMVREGAAKKTGKYLWEATPTTWDWSLAGGAVVTQGGGQWMSKTTTYVPWWDDGQTGAKIFTDRREAVRMARRLQGRVVSLLPSDTKGGG